MHYAGLSPLPPHFKLFSLPFKVFLVYADLRRRILYRIMLSIALSDFLQLYAIWQFTLFEALGFSDWSIYIEKVGN